MSKEDTRPLGQCYPQRGEMRGLTTPDQAYKAERLLEVTRQLSELTDQEAFFQNISDTICELTASEAGSILTLEEETNLLKFVASPWLQRTTLKHVRVPLEGSIAGECFRSGQPVIVQDCCQDKRIYRTVDQMLEFETCSLMAVPLRYRKTTIGVIEAVNKKGKRHYTGEDVTILETLASLVAMTIRNILLGEQVKRAFTELQGLDRMKSDFIAITSHELRTPLGLILGHATDLTEQLHDPASRQQANVIMQSALRLKAILEDLSRSDRISQEKDRLQRKRFILNPLVKEVVASFASIAGRKGVALLIDLPEQSGEIEGDIDKITIALSNLIKNALTFTNEGGHVLVLVENFPGYVKVSIVDDGIGIPSKDLPHIFERFFQVEAHMTRKHGGLGLGLAVAKVMVEIHGGQIWVESIEGRGSNFSFLLPCEGGKSTKGKISAFVAEQ